MTPVDTETTPVDGSASADGRGLALADLTVALLAFATYAATLSAYASWDALRYGVAIASHTPAWLTSAHHPLGGLLAYVVYRAAHALGVDLDALHALQLTSALGGAVTVAGVHAVLRRAGAPPLAALATALALGGSLAFWEVATDGEVYAAATAALVVAWWWMLRAAERGGVAAAGAGVASGLATLGHQLNGVLLLWSPLCFRYVQRPLHAWTIYAVSTAVTIGGGYLCAWHLSDYGRTLKGFVYWSTHYLRVDFHFPAAADPLASGLRGLAASLVPVSGGPQGIAAAAVLAAAVSLCVAALRAGWNGRAHPLAGAAALAALSAAGLAAWWEPDTHKFWVPALVCGWLGVGLALTRGSERQRLGLVCCAAAIVLLNLVTVIQPRAADIGNPYREAARQIAGATAPEDLIIVGTDILGPSVAYYASRPHVTNLFAVFLSAAARGRNGHRTLRDLMDAARARNGRVFLSSDALLVSPERRAKAPGLPATAEALLPGTRQVPVLRYGVAGSERVLFEIVGS